MKVRTNIVRFAALTLVTVALTGCGTTVSRNDSLNTAFGPGEAPSTYRVGGARTETETGSRVTLIHSADTPKNSTSTQNKTTSAAAETE